MNNRLLSIAATLGCLAGGAFSQTGMHAGYTYSNVAFTPANSFYGNSPGPLVGGMDIFPDGRVVVAEWGVPASVYIIDGLQKGGSAATVKRFAKGLDNVMGVKIVDSVIYVMEKEGLTQLLDTNGDGEADQYNCISQTFPSNVSMLNLSFDLGFLDNTFLLPLSSDVATGGYDFGSSEKAGTTAFPGRSQMYRINLNGVSTAYAGGFRNPNGIYLNGSDIFVSENEGSWTSSSKLIHVQQGKFYGHRTNLPEQFQTSNNNVASPPVVWSNYNDAVADATGRSWGNPIMLQKGRYRGHFLIPELVNGMANKVVRVFVERVGGDLQGVIFPFVKSYNNAGVHRIKEGADGSLYLGLLGTTCCWGPRSDMIKGFHVLRPNNTVPFEILAMRSLGQSGFQLEFSKPVGAAANQASSYSVSTWRQVPSEVYGGGNRTGVASLTVSSATVSADGLKVTLEINGMPTAASLQSSPGRVVKVSVSGLSAQDGSALWTQFGFYTLNKYGPGTDYTPAEPTTRAVSRDVETGWKLVSGHGQHFLHFSRNPATPKNVALYDMKGEKRFELREVTGSQIKLETGALSKGMYMVRVQEGRATEARPIMIH